MISIGSAVVHGDSCTVQDEYGVQRFLMPTVILTSIVIRTENGHFP